MMSSSFMRGSRMFRGGVITDVVLLCVFIALAYVYFSRRSSIDDTENVLKAVRKPGQTDTEGNSQHLIDARVKKIRDFRSPECKSKPYPDKKRVSIVTVFFDYSFHDLQTTLSSVLQNTPTDLIEEILVVDDASTLDYIVDKSKAYVASIEKARLIRNSNQLFRSGSRMRGLRESKSDVVVFLEPNTVVSKGWLQPLIQQLKEDPRSLAIPHLDHINDPVSYEYKGTTDSLVSGLSWSLVVRMMDSPTSIQDTTASIPSPAFRGNALAVAKPEFLALGGYDGGFLDGGGWDLELAIRAWLCGSTVKVVPCSRVGVVNLMDPVKIVSPNNIRRVAELWFSGRKNLVFKNTGISETMAEQEQESFKLRKSELDKLNLQCKDIEWFFQQVASHLPTPSEKAVKFGLLRCKTGRCAHAAADNRLELSQCKSEHYNVPDPKMVFELTEDGLLTTDGKCLTVQQTAYILMEDCRHDDTHQKWQHKDDHIINTWSNYCMMHVTDPDKLTDGKRQIAMAQDCGTAPEPQFNSFDFVQL